MCRECERMHLHPKRSPLPFSVQANFLTCVPVPVLRQHLMHPHLPCPFLTLVALFRHGLWWQKALPWTVEVWDGGPESAPSRHLLAGLDSLLPTPHWLYLPQNHQGCSHCSCQSWMVFPGPQTSPPGLLTFVFPVNKYQLVGQVLILEVQLMSLNVFLCFLWQPWATEGSRGGTAL